MSDNYIERLCFQVVYDKIILHLNDNLFSLHFKYLFLPAVVFVSALPSHIQLFSFFLRIKVILW